MLCYDDIEDAQTYRIIVSVLTKNQCMFDSYKIDWMDSCSFLHTNCYMLKCYHALNKYEFWAKVCNQKYKKNIVI